MRIVEDTVKVGRKVFTYRHRPHGPVVAIVALTKKMELVLVRQYRHPVGKSLLEIPAGTVEPGEPLRKAAKRELLEETGFQARTWKRLGGWYPSPAHTGVKKHVFLAVDAVKVRRPHLDPNELLETLVVPLETLWTRFEKLGPLSEGLLVGIALAARYHRGRSAR